MNLFKKLNNRYLFILIFFIFSILLSTAALFIERKILGFGPLYNFYNGDHGRLNMHLPWLHLLFSENFLINRINKKENLNVKKIQDLGLSKYSLQEYKNFFEKSGLKIKYFKTNLSDHPFSIVFNILSKIKFLREYFTYNIYCILEKQQSSYE